MKKIGEIMAEMGFREDASEGVKEAFLKHLMKDATRPDVQGPEENKADSSLPKARPSKRKAPKSAPEQLVFDFFQDQSQKKAKIS